MRRGLTRFSHQFSFIRFESLSFKDPKQPQFPALAFSAKFELTGMNGKFSPEVQQQIDGASSLPIGPTSSVSRPPSSSPSSSTPPKTSGSPSSSSPRPSSTSGGAQGNTGGALGLAAGKLLTGVVATVVGLAMFL